MTGQLVADNPQGLAPLFRFMDGSPPHDGQALPSNTSHVLGQDGSTSNAIKHTELSNWGLKSRYQGRFLPLVDLLYRQVCLEKIKGKR